MNSLISGGVPELCVALRLLRNGTPQGNQRRAGAHKRGEASYLEAFSTATATATVAPTMGLLPIGFSGEQSGTLNSKTVDFTGFQQLSRSDELTQFHHASKLARTRYGH